VTTATIGYATGWIQGFLQRASGFMFEEAQASRIAASAERKLADLFEVAEATALANGRTRILGHDLPLTRGLRARLAEAETLARDVELQPLLVFLADAGVHGPLDEAVRLQIPQLMAMLLVLSARIIALHDAADMSSVERLERWLRRQPLRPTNGEVDNAIGVLDLVL
jgi:hypothetical protein